LVKDQRLPRYRWKIARIEELRISQDGEIRAANVRTPNGRTWERPIKLLVPLECQDDQTQVQATAKQNAMRQSAIASGDGINKKEQPMRAAKARAMEELKQLQLRDDMQDEE
jgi:hypothetical protein